MARRAIKRVQIDGQDITSRLNPVLIEISVTDKAGSASDRATIALNDQGARLQLPSDGATMTIEAGWKDEGLVEIFRGKVSDVRWTTGRGQGDILRISAEGVDPKGKAKETKEKHWDDKKIEEILKEAATEAELNGDVKVDSELGSIKLEYVAMQGESFMAFGERLANMVGGTFRISDGRAALVKKNAGQSASGKPLKPIVVSKGVNLIAADVAPFTGRTRYAEATWRYYDPAEAKWKEEKVKVQDDGAKAGANARFTAASKEEAKSRAKSDKEKAEREKGEGTVEIEGDAFARPESPVTLSGCRPGIDGDYVADGITHKLTRRGFTTSIEIKRPKGSAGKDSRKSSSGGASSSGATGRSNLALNTTGGGGTGIA